MHAVKSAIARALCGILLLVLAPAALAIPINLNDFFADPESAVSINAEGTEAVFSEDLEFEFADVILSNDPFLDPVAVLDPDALGTETTLRFDYAFTRENPEDAGLQVILFETDADTGEGGVLDGELGFFTDFGSSGTYEIDLASPLEGLEDGWILGLQFEFLNFDGVFGNSLLTIANVATFDPNPPTSVPAPPAFWLMLTGLIGLYLQRRKASASGVAA